MRNNGCVHNPKVSYSNPLPFAPKRRNGQISSVYLDVDILKGRHIFPSVGLDAWKIGQYSRQTNKFPAIEKTGDSGSGCVRPKGVNQFHIAIDAFPA
jgi:hypothetical protein